MKREAGSNPAQQPLLCSVCARHGPLKAISRRRRARSRQPGDLPCGDETDSRAVGEGRSSVCLLCVHLCPRWALFICFWKNREEVYEENHCADCAALGHFRRSNRMGGVARRHRKFHVGSREKLCRGQAGRRLFADYRAERRAPSADSDRHGCAGQSGCGHCAAVHAA